MTFGAGRIKIGAGSGGQTSDLDNKKTEEIHNALDQRTQTDPPQEA